MANLNAYQNLIKWRQQNPDYQNGSNNPLWKGGLTYSMKDWRKSRRDKIREFKNKPCEDCGIKYPPYIMQFDHVRGEKLFTLNQAISRTESEVLKEVEKCDVVCANCHAERTYSKNSSAGGKPKKKGYA